MTIKLNVYNDNDEVVKVCEAKTIKLKFGVVRKLMALLKVEDINNNAEMLAMVYGAWDQLTKILSKCFPDMEEEDWDGVDVSELVPVVIAILKDAISNINNIPTESKN